MTGLLIVSRQPGVDQAGPHLPPSGQRQNPRARPPVFRPRSPAAGRNNSRPSALGRGDLRRNYALPVTNESDGPGVIGPGESGRIGAEPLAERAFELLDRGVFVLCQPGFVFVPHSCQHFDSSAVDYRGYLDDVGAGRNRLQHVEAGRHAAGGRQRARQPSGQHADPAERQAPLVRRAERDMGHHAAAAQIDFRLQVAMEQHQSVGAGSDQPPGKIRQSREIRPNLHRQRQLYFSPHRADDVDVPVFDLGRGHGRIDGQDHQVQFQGVGSRLLNAAGIVEPSSGRRPVEAGDNRQRNRLFGPLEYRR